MFIILSAIQEINKQFVKSTINVVNTSYKHEDPVPEQTETRDVKIFYKKIIRKSNNMQLFE